MTDKTISLYTFFILLLVASAIVFMVYSLYGKPVDVREMEGVFLAEKLADCVSSGGKVSAEILDKDGNFLITRENLPDKCNLIFKVEEYKGWNNDQLFVSLDFFSSDGKVLHSVSFGNGNFIGSCNINALDTITKNNSPFCVERKIYSIGGNGEFYTIRIFAGVRKTEKNA